MIGIQVYELSTFDCHKKICELYIQICIFFIEFIHIEMLNFPFDTFCLIITHVLQKNT